MIDTNYNIILGSASTRRKELLEELGLSFSIISSNIEESYPVELAKKEVAKYIAIQKASYLSKKIKSKDLLITADTVVKVKDIILNKPKNKNEALLMLSTISNTKHEVITGVCITTKNKQISFSVTTEVNFRYLKRKEIEFYIEKYNPFDKAGSYGIQDWIGKIGIKSIKGSYTNVIGLPLVELYENLKKIV